MRNKVSIILLAIFITLLGLWVLLVVATLITKSQNGFPSKISKSASVQSLKVCDISYNPQGSPISVTLCGYVETEDPAMLRLYLYKMPNKRFVSKNQPEDFFYEGNFYRELNIDNTGDYLVEVYLFRDLLTSTEFTIVDH